MPRTGTHENKDERKAKYRAWLLEHRVLWILWPKNPDAIRQEVVRVMKRQGVLSKTTGWRDVRLAPILDDLAGVNRDGS